MPDSVVLFFLLGVLARLVRSDLRVPEPLYDTLSILRTLGGIDRSNAGAIAAHYGSVSVVTFAAGLTYLNARGTASEPTMPFFVAVLDERAPARRSCSSPRSRS